MNLLFKAKLRRPADMGGDDAWAFVVLPKAVSGKFGRRGRASVTGTIEGHPFEATLEPDGQLSHWLKIPRALMETAGVATGGSVTLALRPSAEEREPPLPSDFRDLLDASPEARASWDGTTTIARIDWIHWMESAKQAKTRLSRTADAFKMLASGKKRVCCFDTSGYYSKSLSAPQEAE
jgi:hypothetical protein